MNLNMFINTAEKLFVCLLVFSKSFDYSQSEVELLILKYIGNYVLFRWFVVDFN